MSTSAVRRVTRWTPYRPNAKTPWNLERVVHLHRRAALAATWEELQRDLADGCEASIDRLLQGSARGAPTRPRADKTSDGLAAAAAASADILRLEASWFYRMLFGRDPLRERLTLMWHDHFATSQLKVLDVAAMKAQNDELRAKARAPFAGLLSCMMRDRAMLLWLDASSNRKEHPNENLARELLELFTLGVGEYSERDVKEAARALTGWTVDNGRVRFVAELHDAGPKAILGSRARFDAESLLELLLGTKATARRLAWRLCRQFMGEGAVDARALAELAEFLEANELHVGKAVELILRSKAFFAQRNLRTRVSEPAAHVVSCVRALEVFDAPLGTVSMAEWAARLGQRLFFPPNVGGWKGGRSWLSTRFIIGRVNFAAALADGRIGAKPSPVDVIALAQRHRRAKDIGDVVSFLCELLMGVGPEAAGFDAKAFGTRLDQGAARRALARILASVPMQLG